MTKTQERFQKAFVIQVKATLKGNSTEASRARELVSLYKKRLDGRVA